MGNWSIRKIVWSIVLFYFIMGVCYPARLLEIEEAYTKAIEIIVS